MRRALFALTIALALAAPSLAAAPTRYEALFDALWSKVDANFYDPNFHGVDWKAAGLRYRAKLGGVTGDADFKRLASAMLNELRASHTFIAAPSTSPASSVGIAVRFHEIEGKQVATQIAALSPAWRAGLRPGDVLLSPKPALQGEASTVTRIDIARCDGSNHSFDVARAGAFFPPEEPGLRWSSIRISAGRRIGLIVADRFDDGAAELADRAMADLKDTTAVIVDIRGNTGGNASALRLASYFGREATPSIILLSRPYLVGLGHPVTRADIVAAPRVSGAYTDAGVFQAVGEKGGGAAFWSEDMGAKRYSGPVVVLTGEDTGSAAEGFAWFMRLKTKAHIIGRQTAGAFLGGQTFDLPQGWSVTLPVYGLWGPDGGDYGDKPVTPDETIALTRSDVCSGRDRDIEAAMDWLEHQPSP